MQTFIAVCLALLVIEMGIALAAVFAAAISLRQAARAFETLAYRVDAQVENVGTMMQSGWMKALQTAASVASNFWFGRRKTED